MLRALSVPRGPVVACTTAFSGNKEVLLVVQISVGRGLDAVYDSRLQVDHDVSRDVVLVVGLVEEHIFAIIACVGVLHKVAVGTDTVFCAKTFPEFRADCILNKHSNSESHE